MIEGAVVFANKSTILHQAAPTLMAIKKKGMVARMLSSQHVSERQALELLPLPTLHRLLLAEKQAHAMRDQGAFLAPHDEDHLHGLAFVRDLLQVLVSHNTQGRME